MPWPPSTTFKTEPRQAIIAGKTARASLRAEFAELGTLLQDRLMRQLRKYERQAPAFYARVVAARQVVDRPGSGPSAPVVGSQGHLSSRAKRGNLSFPLGLVTQRLGKIAALRLARTNDFA
ncbi:MAG: hypothetical protein WKG07_05520 [Hymenobacter sp.]